MFTMLSAFAQFERSLIKERQREGIVLAKAKGTVYKGRKPALNAERIAQLREQAAAGGKPNKAGEKIAMCGRVEQSEAPRHCANALHAHISDQLKRLGGSSHSYNVAPATPMDDHAP
jgi:DNA invertase Pin-like site-specific DNA recombinase